MVHSKGTRRESQRFRMDLTGKRKYSGRSFEVRCVSAGGDFAARRAIPSSGGFTPLAGATTAARVPVSGRFWGPADTAGDGGQSATFVPGLLLCGPRATGARSAVPFFGLCVSGHSGKSDAVVGDAMRRRVKVLAGEGNGTGDIAHLEARQQYFAFCSPSQELFSLYIRCKAFPPITSCIHSYPHPCRIASLASAEYSAVALIVLNRAHPGGTHRVCFRVYSAWHARCCSAPQSKSAGLSRSNPRGRPSSPPKFPSPRKLHRARNQRTTPSSFLATAAIPFGVCSSARKGRSALTAPITRPSPLSPPMSARKDRRTRGSI